MHILIVDDSSVMRKMVLRALRQAGLGGHDFEEAADGSEALAMIEAKPFDLVLCDWNMPTMDGPTLLEEIGKRNLEIPFCFITTEATSAMRKQASEAGAKAFITKPFTAADLENALGAWID